MKWNEIVEKTRTGLLQIKPAQLRNIELSLMKNGFGAYGKLLTILLCTYFLADITAVGVGHFIPESAPIKNHGAGSGKNKKTFEDYGIIFTRNLFNSQGLIPGEEGPITIQDPGGAPIKSTLPFNLIGTMIMRDEIRSIATIEDKSASLVYPVRVEDEIPSKAKIVKIEPRRVIFVNTASGRREYIELPDDDSQTNPRITLGSRNAGPGIEKVSPNQFSVSRAEVDKTLADFNNVLTQARAVPNFEGGVAQGYKLFQIVPGSIYDKLGLQNNDAILGMNGEPLSDPSKAFEMLQALKSGAPHFELNVKRDGKTMTYSYDFH